MILQIENYYLISLSLTRSYFGIRFVKKSHKEEYDAINL
jgi:hypothetical protein